MFSRSAYIICALLMCYVAFVFYPKWKQQRWESVIGWDVSGYYWYLPATFIYKDLKQQKFADTIFPKYAPTPEYNQSYAIENGNRINVYSAGMAIMYLPFFTAAHIVARPLGYPADGFSTPYQLSLYLSGFLVALTGLWYFRKLLLIYFEDKVVAVMLLLLVIGTNYLNYSTIESSLPHNWLFTIYVFLLLRTIAFYQKPTYRTALHIGILIGLATLIRPSEMIAAIIPLLWGMESISVKAIRQRITFLLSNKQYLLVAAACTILIGSIQVAYWLYVSGKPFVYSYQDKGFTWKYPHVKDYIFSYRSGWLIYTPLLILSFIGLIPFLLKGKNKVAITSFFFVSLYIVCAWDIWWYGGTGGRAMLQSYPVILFPFAWLVKELLDTRVIKWLVSPVVLAFVYVNLWFTYNAHAGNQLYDPEGMSEAYYWAVVGRYSIDRETEKLKDTDELHRDEPRNMKLIYHNDFETDTTATGTLNAIEGKRSFVIDGGHIYTPAIDIPNSKEIKSWIRVETKLYSEWVDMTTWKMSQLIVRFYDKDSIVKDRMIRVNRFLWHGQVRDIFFDVKVPKEHFDRLNVYMWYAGGEKQLMVDDIRISSFD